MARSAPGASGVFIEDTAPIEREHEIATIVGCLEAAVSGSGAGILVQGPAGIGKSVVLGEASKCAAALDMVVLSARGGIYEREYPFGVARQLLEPHLRGQTEAQKSSALGGAGGTAARMVLDGAVDASTPDFAFGVMYGLAWTILNVADDQPLLLCIDDLQWADEPSTRLVAHLLSRITDAPVVVLSALRAGETLGMEQRGMLAELEASGQLQVMEPAPLSLAGTLALTRRILGSATEAEFASACHERTGGNPFYLVELLRELADDGVQPKGSESGRVGKRGQRGVSRVVLTRLARHGQMATALVRALAVLGDDALLADLAALSGLSREQAIEASHTLVEAGLVQESGEGLRFGHPLMHDVVQGDMSEAERAERHAQAADVLAAHGRSAESVAAHALLSPPTANPATVERLLSAAHIALSRASPEESVKLLERALSEPPPLSLLAPVLFGLGSAEAAALRPEAVEHLHAARELLEPTAQRAEIDLALARVLTFAGRSADVYSAVADGQASLNTVDSNDRELGLRLEATKLTVRIMDHSGGDWIDGSVAGLGDLNGATAGERSVLACLAFARAKSGAPMIPVHEMVKRAIGPGASDLAALDPFTPLMLITVLQWGGRLAESGELASAVMEQARDLGSPLLFTEALAMKAMTMWRCGRLRDAEADSRQAFETEGMVAGAKSILAVAALTRALTDRGDPLGALPFCDYEIPVGREDYVTREILLTSLGRIQVALGNFDEALARLAEAGEIADEVGSVNPAASEWRVLSAEAYVGLGRDAEARTVLEPALAVARHTGSPSALGPTLRIAGLTEQPVNTALLREALDVLESSELHLERARVLADLGASLRRGGSRRDARQPLLEAMDIAHQCGADPLVDRVRAELQASGARPRRERRTGLEALTPSERRVAQHACEGRSNREIAQRLFVSPRTVEAHLRSVYGKLGVTSRLELARVLAIPGPEADR